MATKTSTEDWIEELKSISVLELSERIKALEEEFGVSIADDAFSNARTLDDLVALVRGIT